MRKVFALFMAAACILGATILSTPKAASDAIGQVDALAYLYKYDGALNVGAVGVNLSGFSLPVDVSYSIKVYEGRNYVNLSTVRKASFVVLKSSYSNMWTQSAKNANSLQAFIEYKSSEGSKSKTAQKSL